MRAAPPVLIVKTTEVPRDVIRRALVRPSAQRFGPLIARDEYGGYVGIIPIERLTTLVLGEAPPIDRLPDCAGSAAPASLEQQPARR